MPASNFSRTTSGAMNSLVPYLPNVPRFRFLCEAEEIGPVVTPEHFELFYKACQAATMPKQGNCEPGDW